MNTTTISTTKSKPTLASSPPPLRSAVEEGADLHAAQQAYAAAQALFESDESDTNYDAKEATRKTYEQAQVRHRRAIAEEVAAARAAKERELDERTAAANAYPDNASAEAAEFAALLLRATTLLLSITEKSRAAGCAQREAAVLARELGVGCVARTPTDHAVMTAIESRFLTEASEKQTSASRTFGRWLPKTFR